MKVNMKATFDKKDLQEIMKAEYVKRFGAIQPGYDLMCTDQWGEYTVEMYKQEDEVEL